jgi:signal transduction histidine kinase
VRKDGTRFLSHVIIDAIRDDDGRLIGFAKITRDVTERKTAQEALERAREALFQSQKMDAVGQLTGGVAHDFNNLLMVITGNLELIEHRAADKDSVRELAQAARNAAERGASPDRAASRLLAQAETKPKTRARERTHSRLSETSTPRGRRRPRDQTCCR